MLQSDKLRIAEISLKCMCMIFSGLLNMKKRQSQSRKRRKVKGAGRQVQ